MEGAVSRLSDLLETPLTALHRDAGARMVPFAGYAMPVQYHSIIDEHRSAREGAALFDVSHMGQVHLRGPSAIADAERLVTCPVASLAVGQVRYGCLCNDDGGVVDDVTVYRLADDVIFFCVNAANIAKDAAWIRDHASPDTIVEDRSDATALIAIQGPEAMTALQGLAGEGALGIRRFRFATRELAGHEVLVSNTGYTGSAGFELYCAPEAAPTLWSGLCKAGGSPAGLGARDTLRLEAALPLYGHELDDTTSPLEARLDRFVKLEQGGFIGAEAIARRREAGHPRLLAGFQLLGRGIARADHPIAEGDREVGIVTSGAPSPTLGKSIGLGYVPPALAEPGARFDVLVRGRPVAAQVVKTPFYRKTRSA